MKATEEPPRWDTSILHESFDSRSYRDAIELHAAGMTRLEALFDEHGIRAVEPRAVTPADGATADAVIRALNEHSAASQPTGSWLHSWVTTDSFHEQALGQYGQFQMVEARRRPLMARLAEWLKSLGVEELAAVSTEVAEHRGTLDRLAERAERQMTEAEESLYAELVGSGSSAWAQLQGTVTSQLTATVHMPDGTSVEHPMTVVRGMATHEDAEVRKAAYEAELEAWPKVTAVCAAAMNGVKGETDAVNRRRGWASPLDASLFANNVDRDTYEAMQQAVVEHLPFFRNYLTSKAKIFGHEGGLPWYDLFAPLPGANTAVNWKQGMGIVLSSFRSYGPDLVNVLERALDDDWIDAEPRRGKRGGAYCMPFVDDRSLIFLNWAGSLDDVTTAAHELGHAFHNTHLAKRTPLQRQLPMALAETASIFCETLMFEEGVRRLKGKSRMVMLDTNLQGATQVVLDIRSRLLFETEVFARRRNRTLGPAELDELMLECQRDAYGDGLDHSTLHPHMWALKPHYYSSNFYNWPYTFGLLFGLGLYSRFTSDPERFKVVYGVALSRTGIDDARTLGHAFGIDIADVDFWRKSLDVIRKRTIDFENWRKIVYY